MADSTQELAQALYDSGKKSKIQIFTINDRDGDPSGEEIVVIALRTTPRGRNLMKNMVELTESYKAIAGPAGQPCPLCGGSGRI